MRALLSVFDKTGIVELAEKLVGLGHEIVSTGGTGQLLNKHNIPFIPIEEITGNPESFGGRMKTISFEVASALLFRRHEQESHDQSNNGYSPLAQGAASHNDLEEAKKLGIVPIDLVVCNLYPFIETTKKETELSKWIEMIDIGGPTMIRAAAKNYFSVTVVTDPSDYPNIIKELTDFGKTSLQTRERLALKAFSLTSTYDLSIQTVLNAYFASQNNHSILPSFSQESKSLRYGENPHQSAKLFVFKNTTSQQTLAESKVLQGKEISYNNYLDSDAAFKCASELKITFPTMHSAVIVKHGTPCGIATSSDSINAIEEAWKSDEVSAFGSIIAFTDNVTVEVASFLKGRFIEVVIAPSFSDEALKLFSEKKNVRLIQVPLKKLGDREFTVRSISGGLLVQDEDETIASSKGFAIKTGKGLNELDDRTLHFGQTVIKYLKSNCLALVEHVKSPTTGAKETFRIVASGVGQPNRLECLTKLIAPKVAGKDISQSILVSDAFFPFRDSIDEAHKLGIKNILQPGGSINDSDVIAAAKEHGMSMAFTGHRHFRH